MTVLAEDSDPVQRTAPRGAVASCEPGRCQEDGGEGQREHDKGQMRLY